MTHFPRPHTQAHSRSHAPHGNALQDALHPALSKDYGAVKTAFPCGAWEREEVIL